MFSAPSAHSPAKSPTELKSHPFCDKIERKIKTNFI